jgi:hypothetical protein
LKHDFGRYGLALEADAAQIAPDQRSGGIPMLDLTCDALRLLRQNAFARRSLRVKADPAMITKSYAGRVDATN